LDAQPNPDIAISAIFPFSLWRKDGERSKINDLRIPVVSVHADGQLAVKGSRKKLLIQPKRMLVVVHVSLFQWFAFVIHAKDRRNSEAEKYTDY
jgi:hypothetical protein